MTVFRAYDIRGEYPTEITEELAEQIGRAFGTFNPGTIAVGGDVRTSTPVLKERMIKGLLSTGATVVDLGMVATPMLYFAVASKGFDGGLMVTASHNPKQDNGFKPVARGGICYSWETGINKMKDVIDQKKYKTGTGKLQKLDITEDYIRHLLSATKPVAKKHVVLDAANGATSLIAPLLFQRLGWKVTPLFCEPDGRFPNHEADPIKKENLRSLQQKVLEVKADLGLAFDGDGDRLGAVNERGQVVENNKIFSLLLAAALAKKTGPVVYEVVVSRMVEDTIRRAKGTPILSRVGHSYIQSRLAQEKAVMAGENSGHYYFPENFGYDDSLFAALKVCELLTVPMSTREKEIPDYITSEEFRPKVPDEKKFQIVTNLQTSLKKQGFTVIDLDGARVHMDGGWFIVRASNTGPQLVVRWEGTTQEAYDRVGRILKAALEEQGVKLGTKDMRDTMLALPQQISQAFALPLRNVDPKAFAGVTKIVFLGMGGSGIVGNIIRDLVDAVPVYLSKSYTPPAWVDAKTLVICISYSGNTKETLNAYHAILKKSPRIVGMTSGGKLLELLAEEGRSHIALPAGMLPRESLPFQLFSLLNFLDTIGLYHVDKEKVVAFAESLLPIEQDAVALATRLVGKMPFIYGTLESPCLRFKCQLNENAKTLAGYGTFPEINHNEVVGWSGSPKGSCVVLLRDPQEREDVAASIEFLKSTLTGKADVFEWQARGTHPLEKLLSFIFFGDLVSYHVAKKTGVDPATIEYINMLKKIIKE